MTLLRYGMLLLFAFLSLSSGQMTTAQGTVCDVVDSINYPVDTNAFSLVQDYNVASPRHQGRFHTGEDWFGGPNASLGQPIRAIANGRVLTSSPNGWGRDGGVVIIEHTLPDETIIYSQYGHIQPTDAYPFPTQLSCIQAGEIIGAIGESRPAPHLHFEMRVLNTMGSGPGYTREDPDELGWQRPAQMIANIQLQLNRAYSWHTPLSIYEPSAPPLVLNDNSLMVIDGERLRRITEDGRVLWRVSMQSTAAIAGYQGSPVLVYADGAASVVDFEGVTGEGWQIADFDPNIPLSTDIPPFTLPVLADDGETTETAYVFHRVDDSLIALSPDFRSILWRTGDVPRFERAYVSPSLIALVAEGGQSLSLYDVQGQFINQVALRKGADMATSREGELIVYTQGGLWTVDERGNWDEFIEGVPPGGGAGAVAATDDGRIFLTDGDSVYAYTRLGTLDWQATLPRPVRGQVSLDLYGGAVLVTSNHGDVIALRESGGICGFTGMYGDDYAAYWHSLGDDGVLRLRVGDQLVGLDWGQLTNGC